MENFQAIQTLNSVTLFLITPSSLTDYTQIWIHLPFLGIYGSKLTNSFIWKISPLLKSPLLKSPTI